MDKDARGDADEVRRIRAKLGLSRMQVAGLIDRSDRTVKQVELGLQRLGHKALERLREAERRHDAGEPSFVLPRYLRDDEASRFASTSDVAAVVADPRVQEAVAAMIKAGLSQERAWAAMLHAKLDH